MESAASAVAKEAKRQLQDCSRVVVFSAGAHEEDVIYATCAVRPGELQQLAASFGDRDAAIQQGVWLEGRRYEVHRHHPPLVYGRAMADCEPEASTGFAVCRVERSRLAGSDGGPAYIAVTYEQPHTSARIVPRVLEFAQQQLGAP